MKIGLDFDGVINKYYWILSPLTHLLLSHEQEVHILTGNRGTSRFLKDLEEKYGIAYTHFYSISDYHQMIGTPMTGYDQNNTWIEEDIWDRSKGIYAKKHALDLHFDDSPIYGNYFDTPYCHVDEKMVKWVINLKDKINIGKF